jgi:hypothetical protein
MMDNNDTKCYDFQTCTDAFLCSNLMVYSQARMILLPISLTSIETFMRLGFLADFRFDEFLFRPSVAPDNHHETTHGKSLLSLEVIQTFLLLDAYSIPGRLFREGIKHQQ